MTTNLYVKITNEVLQQVFKYHGILKIVQDRAMLTVADCQEVELDLSNGAITEISRARHYSTLNISETIGLQDRHVITTYN